MIIKLDMIFPFSCILISFIGLVLSLIPVKSIAKKVGLIVCIEVLVMTGVFYMGGRIFNTAEDLGYVEDVTGDMYVTGGRITKEKLLKKYKYSQPNGITYTLHEIKTGEEDEGVIVQRNCVKKFQLFGQEFLIYYNRAFLTEEDRKNLETIGTISTS